MNDEDGVQVERTKKDVAFLDSDDEGEMKGENDISLQMSLKQFEVYKEQREQQKAAEIENKRKRVFED